MSWGIAETASGIEKIKSESADYLNGLNSCGVIDWNIYNYAFDFYSDLLMKAYEQGRKDARLEPCGDAVNRQRLLDDLKKLKTAWKKYPVMEEQIKGVEAAIEYVELIPSVMPKPDHIGDATEMVKYDDCVSRQAVADVAYEVGNLFDGENDTRTPYEVAFDIQVAVDKLPSVTPKRKTGKWIVHYECPKCGEITKDFMECCPFCGTDMRGGQDEPNKQSD